MSLRVMIVEDEALIAMQLESILDDDGQSVVGIARTMSEALRIAALNPHLDLAVMDVDLAHGPDGVHTARRLREEFDVASLFVSARLTDEVRARASAWEPVGFIGKPFSDIEILRVVANLSQRPVN